VSHATKEDAVPRFANHTQISAKTKRPTHHGPDSERLRRPVNARSLRTGVATIEVLGCGHARNAAGTPNMAGQGSTDTSRRHGPLPVHPRNLIRRGIHPGRVLSHHHHIHGTPNRRLDDNLQTAVRLRKVPAVANELRRGLTNPHHASRQTRQTTHLRCGALHIPHTGANFHPLPKYFHHDAKVAIDGNLLATKVAVSSLGDPHLQLLTISQNSRGCVWGRTKSSFEISQPLPSPCP
jgi:hypothetical protein